MHLNERAEISISRKLEEIFYTFVSFILPISVFLPRSFSIPIVFVFLALSIFALLINPFRHEPKSALVVSMIYGTSAMISIVNLVDKHHLRDAIWATAFVLFAIAWAFRYRQSRKIALCSEMAQHG